ncbi:hypothetical protein HJ588_06515 [Flexivirga sp. ID2601S]|uniref:Uncharacterized protein n=1 Tax=Flexivirga aerilata TaxID=1656889 RepID=A0A849AH85_9MICO|nr:hypothetical protein [Flexivirga aerilata]NNG38926.1 hypothetical protein [Flexivirga aerilata]
MNNFTGPALDTELAYRRERIAHDFAVAHGWELSLRRVTGWARRLAGGGAGNGGQDRPAAGKPTARPLPTLTWR